MARFVKGKSGNEKGRAVGSKNFISKDCRNLMRNFISEGVLKVIEDFRNERNTHWFRLHVMNFFCSYAMVKESEMLKMELSPMQIEQIILYIKENEIKK